MSTTFGVIPHHKYLKNTTNVSIEKVTEIENQITLLANENPY